MMVSVVAVSAEHNEIVGLLEAQARIGSVVDGQTSICLAKRTPVAGALEGEIACAAPVMRSEVLTIRQPAER